MSFHTQKHNTFVLKSPSPSPAVLISVPGTVAAPRNTILDPARLPRKPYCGWDKEARVRSRRIAMTRPRLQIDLPTHRMAIAIDVDDNSDYGMAWQDAGLPEPTWAAMSTVEHPVLGQIAGRPHYIWLLEAPVARGSKAQIAYFESIRRGFIAALEREGVTVDHQIPVTTRNPDYEDWIVRCSEPDRLYALDTLAEAVEIDRHNREESPSYHRPAIRRQAPDTDHALEGRNCDLFEVATFHAYAIFSDFACYGDFFDAVSKHVHDLNNRRNAGNPLPTRECDHIAQSIATWTWKNYTGAGKRRGAMAAHLSPEMSIRDRQVASAVRSAKMNTENSLKKLTAAAERLVEDGEKITKRGLAREAGVSPNTVRKYWSHVTSNGASAEVVQIGSTSGSAPGRGAAGATEGPQLNAGQEERKYNTFSSVGEDRPEPEDLAEYSTQEEFDEVYQALLAVKEGRMSNAELSVLFARHEAAATERWRAGKKPRWRFANDQADDFSDEPAGDGSVCDPVWSLSDAA